jgi:hypothetical protein
MRQNVSKEKQKFPCSGFFTKIAHAQSYEFYFEVSTQYLIFAVL